MVVNECDSSIGCDKCRNYQPRCRNNSVLYSEAVWKAMGVPRNQWGEINLKSLITYLLCSYMYIQPYIVYAVKIYTNSFIKNCFNERTTTI